MQKLNSDYREKQTAPPAGTSRRALRLVLYDSLASEAMNTWTTGVFLAGKITKLKPSRPLKLPDGLRPTGALTFVMAEGGGSADRLTLDGDRIDVKTIKDGIAGPTSVAVAGRTLWITEGQLPHLFEASKNGPPHLPFRIIGVPIQSTPDQDSN